MNRTGGIAHHCTRDSSSPIGGDRAMVSNRSIGGESTVSGDVTIGGDITLGVDHQIFGGSKLVVTTIPTVYLVPTT